MKKQYNAPEMETVKVDTASFLEVSGEIGDAVAVDNFESSFGRSF